MKREDKFKSPGSFRKKRMKKIYTIRKGQITLIDERRKAPHERLFVNKFKAQEFVYINGKREKLPTGVIKNLKKRSAHVINHDERKNKAYNIIRERRKKRRMDERYKIIRSL